LSRASSLYESEPIGDAKTWFVNSVIEIETEFPPDGLLKRLKAIEKAMGRKRVKGKRWGSRVIDLDILLCDQEVVETKSLKVPHRVTPHPSLVAKTGRDFETVLHEICALVDGPVSAEVVSTEAPGMVEEGARLARIHRNIVVKCPMIPEGLKATRALTDRGIRVNVTLVFQAAQALLAAKAGAAFISPFVGRLDDVGHDG